MHFQRGLKSIPGFKQVPFAKALKKEYYSTYSVYCFTMTCNHIYNFVYLWIKYWNLWYIGTSYTGHHKLKYDIYK